MQNLFFHFIRIIFHFTFRILQFVLNNVVGAADVGIGANAARLCMIISHLTQKAILFLEKRTCMQPLYRGYARKKKNAP